MRLPVKGEVMTLPAALCEACRTAIAARWGLDYSGKEDDELRRLLHRAATVAGGNDPQALARRLVANRLSRNESAALASGLTVGETYFMRDPRFLAHLRDRFLGPLIDARRRNGQYQLTLWSAACAGGEEAYSLAILVDSLLPDRERWTVTLLGSDLDAQALANAGTGCYGPWSFRRVDEHWRERYFVKVAPQRWQLRAGLRAQVRFFEHNLAAEADAGHASLPDRCDLILCRNVLMYFVPAQAWAALRRLRERLSPQGCIVLSAVESLPAQLGDLDAVLWPEALCLRPGERRLEADETRLLPSASSLPPIPDPAPFIPLVPPTEPLPPLSEMPPRPMESRAEVDPEPEPNELLVQARRQADGGRLAEAVALLERLLARQPTCAEGHRLLAEVQLEQGRVDAARRSLAKVLYLCPNRTTVHYQYGLVCRRLGRRQEATRHLYHALRLLERESGVEGEEAFSVDDLRRQLLEQLEGVKHERI